MMMDIHVVLDTILMEELSLNSNLKIIEMKLLTNNIVVSLLLNIIGS